MIEAAGAAIPMISTNVGGIPEIFGPFKDDLIPCNDVARLANAMTRELDRPQSERAARAAALRAYVMERFTITDMAASVISGYRDALRMAGLAPAEKILLTR